ncbi:MAG: hypothetical protein AB7P04_14815 [Bacteriovoracia bacterium]
MSIEKKLGTIAIIADDRASAQKAAVFATKLNALRIDAVVELLKATTTDEQMVAKLEAKPYSLVLAPWHKYFEWSKVDGYFGRTRTQGPCFAGYFLDPLPVGELEAIQNPHLRTLLIDFDQLSGRELKLVVNSLADEKSRSGVFPLLDSNTLVYCDTWMNRQGAQEENLFKLSEMKGTSWSSRINSIRICLTALWSIVFEDGIGNSELATAITTHTAKAYFQVAIEPGTLAIRLCFNAPQWRNPTDAIKAFWPSLAQHTQGSQLLMKYADLVRLHMVAESSQAELTLVFFSTAPAEKIHGVHTLIVESINNQLVKEPPYIEAEGSPHPRHLPMPKGVDRKANARELETQASIAREKARERALAEAASEIRDYRQQIAERDHQLREFRMGGVGAPAPIEPLDMESLLETFKVRVADAQNQLADFERRLGELAKVPGTKAEILRVQRQMQALENQQLEWIRQIAAVVQGIKKREVG